MLHNDTHSEITTEEYTSQIEHLDFDPECSKHLKRYNTSIKTILNT